MKPTPSIAILIVNYNTEKYIENLLESFQKFENYCGNIVFYIADNASDDDLYNIPIIFPHLSIHIIQLQRNYGFGGANNRLVEHTSESILFFINPDIEWIESTIQGLVTTLLEYQVTVIGPKLYNSDGAVQVWDHGESRGILAGLMQHLGSSFWKNQNKTMEVAWVSGAAFMMRSKDFQSIGGFDESFFLYQEEVDLCKRIRNNNGVILYKPDSRMKHIGSVVAKKSKYMIISVDRFLEKHHPFLYRIKLVSFIHRIYFWIKR